jgi:Planctomycete cytochrome C
MKQTFVILAVSTAAAVSSAIAADIDVSKLPPPADKKGVTYAQDIQPIFKSSCFGCHGEQRQRGGLRLDSLEAVLKGGDDGEVVTPGKSEKSVLVIAVARLDPKKAMPPMRGPGRGPGGTNAPPGGFAGGPPPGGSPDGPPPGDFHGGPPPGGFPPPGGSSGGPPPGGFAGGRPGGRGGPPAKPLSREQVALIRAWVDQGVK